MGILSLILWTPAAGALFLALTPNQNFRIIRTIANLFVTLVFFLSCWLLSIFDQHNASIQLSEYYPLNPNLGSA